MTLQVMLFWKSIFMETSHKWHCQSIKQTDSLGSSWEGDVILYVHCPTLDSVGLFENDITTLQFSKDCSFFNKKLYYYFYIIITLFVLIDSDAVQSNLAKDNIVLVKSR